MTPNNDSPENDDPDKFPNMQKGKNKPMIKFMILFIN